MAESTGAAERRKRRPRPHPKGTVVDAAALAGIRELIGEQPRRWRPCICGEESAMTESIEGKRGMPRLLPADERPDEEYPYVLITGRQLEHWHTGAMTRRASVLNAIEPLPVISSHPEDLEQLGELTAYARVDRGLRRGEIFIPFCYHEAAANVLTNAALDPYGKIPEFKYCAVKVEPAPAP